MKRRVLLAAVLGVTAWLTPQSAEAFGGKLFGGRGKGCAVPVMTGGCGAVPVTADCGGCGATVPATPVIEQEVIVYEIKETKSKQKVKVLKPVEVEKDVVYKVLTPTVTRKEVLVNEWVRVEKPTEYHVNEWVKVQEECDVVTYNTIQRKVVVNQVSYVCQPRQVVETVAVQTKVPVCPDPCAGFFARMRAPRFTTVTECQTVCKTVIDRIAVTTPVETVVTESVPVRTKKMMDVMKCQLVKRAGVAVTYECRPVKKMTDVHECLWVEKKDKVKVWECKEVEDEIEVVTCEYVAVKKKVMVPAPVATPCATGCGTPTACAPAACEDPCARKGFFARLFRR